MSKIKEMLEIPFAVVTANTGAHALKLVMEKGRPSPFDLIIMEPDQNGIEASIKIREFLQTD